MSHMIRIMAEQAAGILEDKGLASESILVKVAASLCAEEMRKTGSLNFPENPVLETIRSKMSQMPIPEMPNIQQALSRYLMLDLKNNADRMEKDLARGPITMEADRLREMASLIRTRIELLQNMKELQLLQSTMAQEMGLSPDNPAVAASGEMPAAIAGQQPLAPPEAVGAPGEVTQGSAQETPASTGMMPGGPA